MVIAIAKPVLVGLLRLLAAAGVQHTLRICACSLLQPITS